MKGRKLRSTKKFAKTAWQQILHLIIPSANDRDSECLKRCKTSGRRRWIERYFSTWRFQLKTGIFDKGIQIALNEEICKISS